MDTVDVALAAVPQGFYVLEPDGRPVPQTTNPALILAMLRLADVQPRSRVLEIGTGSGYSTALLAHLVGTAGFVTSLDIDAALVQRAKRLLSEQEIRNTTVVAADGQAGYPSETAFDRIIAWASADQLPQAWGDQLQVGGLIIAPVKLAPLGHAIAVIRARRVSEGKLVGEQVISGSFVALTNTPQHHWGDPPQEADIVVAAGDEPSSWLSAEWLRAASAQADKIRVAHLCHSLVKHPGPLLGQEDVWALRACLLASLPEGLSTALTQASGGAIGCSDRESLALLSLRNGILAESGTGAATAKLIQWIEAWRACGRPGFEATQPSLAQTLRGWSARVVLKQPWAAQLFLST